MTTIIAFYHPRIVCCLLIAATVLAAGCSQSIMVTRKGNPMSNDNISVDQFNRLRSDKYFDMHLNDSTVVPVKLISASVDSIIIETVNSEERMSVPVTDVARLEYHQNDQGFNAMIGAFVGLVISGAVSRMAIDPHQSSSSVKGFALILSGTAAGGWLGYNSTSTIDYRFDPERKY